MSKIELLRVYLPTETLGSLYMDGDMIVKTMELPWKNNKRSTSCIPEGEYDVIKEETSLRHTYPHFRILNVKGRSGILIHKITYVKDLKGCIGVGMAFSDLNKDGVPDMIKSTIAINKLYDTLPNKFKLSIKKNLNKGL